jgi:hypothetical protein
VSQVLRIQDFRRRCHPEKGLEVTSTSKWMLRAF